MCSLDKVESVDLIASVYPFFFLGRWSIHTPVFLS